jgi:hypothetical protein
MISASVNGVSTGVVSDETLVGDAVAAGFSLVAVACAAEIEDATDERLFVADEAMDDL